MAPSSANRNPETRKPARALPLPGARVAPVLLAMSIIFDCIISDVRPGKGGAGRTPWPARDAPIPLPEQRHQHLAGRKQADGGVARGPGGPPYQCWTFEIWFIFALKLT